MTNGLQNGDGSKPAQAVIRLTSAEVGGRFSLRLSESSPYRTQPSPVVSGSRPAFSERSCPSDSLACPASPVNCPLPRPPALVFSRRIGFADSRDRTSARRPTQQAGCDHAAISGLRSSGPASGSMPGSRSWSSWPDRHGGRLAGLQAHGGQEARRSDEAGCDRSQRLLDDRCAAGRRRSCPTGNCPARPAARIRLATMARRKPAAVDCRAGHRPIRTAGGNRHQPDTAAPPAIRPAATAGDDSPAQPSTEPPTSRRRHRKATHLAVCPARRAVVRSRGGDRFRRRPQQSPRLKTP